MHEMGIVAEIVEVVASRAGSAKVVRVAVEVGKLSTVSPDALRFCFDVATEGTVLEGAALEIRETDGLARCRACGGTVVLDRPFGRCACGGTDLEWLSGDELRIREMEVA